MTRRLADLPDDSDMFFAAELGQTPLRIYGERDIDALHASYEGRLASLEHQLILAKAETRHYRDHACRLDVHAIPALRRRIHAQATVIGNLHDALEQSEARTAALTLLLQTSQRAEPQRQAFHVPGTGDDPLRRIDFDAPDRNAGASYKRPRPD